MKKHILLTLAAAGLFLAACGEQPAQSSSPTPTPSSESSIVPSGSSDSSAASSDSSAASSDSSAASSDSSSSVEPVVINTVEVVILDGSATCHIGDVLLVQAKVNGATSTAVTWSSSDTEKATVTAAGAVTVKALGKVKIIATSKVDTTKKGEVELDVVETAPTPIKDVKKDKTVKVLAKVTAYCAKEYVYIDDGTGAAAIYFGKGTAVPADYASKVGSVIQVEGKATEYYGQIQFYASGDGAATITWPTDKTVQSTTMDDPTEVTASTIADYLPEGSKAIGNAVAVSFTAPAIQAGTYVNWKLGNYLVSYKSKNSSLPSLEAGYNYEVKGYLASYNSSSSYFPLIGVKVTKKDAVVLTGLSFAKESENIDQHEFIKLEPIAIPDGAQIGELQWSSSAEAVATVDANGTVQGLTQGSAVITATLKSDANIKATITINVSDKEVVETYTPLKDLADKTAYKVRGVITAKTKDYVYIDDGTDVAAIKASGDEYVIGKEMVIDGTTSFYYGEKQFADGSLATIRDDAKITEVTLTNPLTLTAENIVAQKDKGNISSQAVTFTADAAKSGDYVNWKIGDLFLSYASKPADMPSLVEGANYTVTGYIRSYNSSSKYFGIVAVTVERNYATLEGLTISDAAPTIKVGDTKALSVTPTPATADGTVTWASADPEKVSVSETGVITGIAVTTSPVAITATSTVDPTKTAVANVTVEAAPEGEVTVTKTPTQLAAENSWANGDVVTSVTIGKVDFAFSFTNSNKSKYYTNASQTKPEGDGIGQLRCYLGQGDDKSGTITVTAQEGYVIKSITFSYIWNKNHGIFPLASGTADTVNATSKTYTVTNNIETKAENEQFKINGITVVYDKAA